MGRMDGKVALITGGARGQGRSHAKTLAREGADVILVDVAQQIEGLPYASSSMEDLKQTVAEVEELDQRALAVQADVRSQADLDAAVAAGIKEFGKIDVLVANAGVWTIGPFWELTEERWQMEIDICLSGVWRAAKAVAPHMMERNSGSIVMTSSVLGYEGSQDCAHYVSAKHGVLGLMKTVAIELGVHNIRCNAVCPGFIDTPMNDRQAVYDLMAGGEHGLPEHRLQAARHWSLLAGRTVLDAQSVSNAVLFLASDESSDITGTAVRVDAGHLATPGFNPAPVESVDAVGSRGWLG